MPEIKDYKYEEITEKKIKKDDYTLSDNIPGIPERSELNQKMSDILSQKGIVFFITKDKVVNGIVTLFYDSVDAAVYNLDKIVKKDEKSDGNAKVNIYETKDIYLSEDLKSQENVVMKDLTEEVKEHITSYTIDVRVIKCGDVVIVDRSKEGVSIIVTCMVFGLILGTVLGFVFGEGATRYSLISTGFFLGLLFGLYRFKSSKGWS